MVVVERIIRTCSNEGDGILDPFMGSGTTAEVALRLGRKVVGFEILEKYCRIIEDRLHAVVNPPARKRKQSWSDGEFESDGDSKTKEREIVT